MRGDGLTQFAFQFQALATHVGFATATDLREVTQLGQIAADLQLDLLEASGRGGQISLGQLFGLGQLADHAWARPSRTWP